MKGLFAVASILLSLISVRASSAFEIDISNSSFEVINSQQFKVRQVLASGYPGTYWADFLWNPDQLVFQPTSAAEEPSTTSPKSGIAIVGRGDGYYSDPIAAMNDLASWCGVPSEANPCLIKILPGIYDLGLSALQMKPYVDIEGSGENVTKIQGQGELTLIDGKGPAELRHVTVENTGGGAIGSIAIVGRPSLTVSDSTVISTKGTNGNYGVYCPTPVILAAEETPSSESPLRLRNVTVLVAGIGSFGVHNGCTVNDLVIEQSSIIGPTSVYTGEHSNTFIANTRLSGGVEGTGMTTCAGVYDANFTFYSNTCP